MPERADNTGGGSGAAGGGGAGTVGRVHRLRRDHEWFDHLLLAGERYKNQYGDFYAAAVTYFSVLALVPLLMITVAVAGFVLRGNPQLLTQAKVSITDAVPNAALSEMLSGVVDEAVAKAAAVGVIGLITALYSGLGWMTNLREALTAQWSQSLKQLPFVRKTLSDLGALVGLGVALAVSFVLSALGGGVGEALFTALGFADTLLAQVLLAVLPLVLAVAANWFVFVWVLARLPRKPVTLRSATWGALFAAVGFELLKQLGVVYLNMVTGSPSGAAFGPILGLLVFAYLASRFVLFVTAWTATSRDNLVPERPIPPEPAVIQPVVPPPSRGHAASLFGAGFVAGWLLRRRR